MVSEGGRQRVARSLAETDILLNKEGRLLHLDIAPGGDYPQTVILVGDPARVELVGSHLSAVRLVADHRQFRTIVGEYGGMPVMVVSHGIGCGAMDIVVNELDALHNVDMEGRCVTAGPVRELRLVRLGTCGAVHGDVGGGEVIGTAVSAEWSGGGYYYSGVDDISDRALGTEIGQHIGSVKGGPYLLGMPGPVCVASDGALVEALRGVASRWGITVSMPGFYAAQCREVRLGSRLVGLIECLGKVQVEGLRVENVEMESGMLNILARLLGHRSVTLCVAINNRGRGDVSVDYGKAMDGLIERVLERLRAAS